MAFAVGVCVVLLVMTSSAIFSCLLSNIDEKKAYNLIQLCVVKLWNEK